jgi:hypothetical protein
MAETRIEGRHGTTIISEGYGITAYSGPPTPADDPSRWHSELIDEKGLYKRYDWTHEDVMAAKGRFGFPGSCRQTPIAGTMLRSGYTRHEWRLDAVVEWEDQIRTLAAKLPKK